MGIGARIAARREALALTQAALAYRLSTPEKHLDSMTISRWERGGMQPRLDAVVCLAEALEVSVQWLVTGVPALPGDPAEAAA